MKRFIFLINLILVFHIASAQTKAISFDVNGLKVILKPTQKETVSMSMFFKGGVMNYNAERAGIENLALASAATCGTKNYSVVDYQELADEYGIDISGSSTTDYGTISMNCISKYLDQGWKLFSDAVINPAFDKTEFQTTKERMITGIYHSQSDPETRIEQLTMESMFKDSPYSINPLGTSKTVGGFTAEIVSNYYHNELLNKNKMFLVVAANITKEELEKKIQASFSALKGKDYTPPIYDRKILTGEHLVIEQRDIATNYMSCIMNAPTMTNADYYAFVLTINALSGSMNYELRTKLGLSYAPGATVKVQQIPYTSMFVSTTQPKKAFKAMVSVYNNIKEGKYSERYLEALKKDHRDRYYRHQESASSIVKDLGEAEVLGDYSITENMVANFNKVSLQDMKDSFGKYLKGAIWIYLGDEQVGRAAFQ
ncbi:insulinase family protein [Pedobacter riviphilus]|uniref:Insulinase family protein n=1 Tax=Pedobacter riviphilus TaxID=2766984 RepID=A0ABX6TN38_9SPHI|nr:pitrilysin family protein [Pedobacter riviphilus]QNR86275.1 insulinase family protein [Pedobacter riviphilus]